MTNIGQCQILAIFNLFSKNANLPSKTLFVQQVMSLEVLCDYDGLKARIQSEIIRFKRATSFVVDRTMDCYGENF